MIRGVLCACVCERESAFVKKNVRKRDARRASKKKGWERRVSLSLILSVSHQGREKTRGGGAWGAPVSLFRTPSASRPPPPTPTQAVYNPLPHGAGAGRGFRGPGRPSPAPPDKANFFKQRGCALSAAVLAVQCARPLFSRGGPPAPTPLPFPSTRQMGPGSLANRP